jgi:CBS domain containing-hemolysin-like protein
MPRRCAPDWLDRRDRVGAGGGLALQAPSRGCNPAAMTGVLLIGMLVLILLNAFFVAAEFALVRARRSRLERVAKEDASAQLALREIGDISEYLSACQLGVTLASIGIGFLGEPAVADLIHPWLGGAVSHGLALAISLTIAYVLTTALHITIGEQVPKLFAISRAESIARTVARPLYWFLPTPSCGCSGSTPRSRSRRAAPPRI